jgi:hypothetical protein
VSPDIEADVGTGVLVRLQALRAPEVARSGDNASDVDVD